MKHIQLTDTPIDHQVLLSLVMSPRVGGIVSFIGTVRNHTGGKSVTKLIFESYDVMAIKEMHKIADTCLSTWAIDSIVISHRKGELAIGETPVVIIVGAAHRGVAFEACEYAIDQLKKTVPIWKKEVFEDGEIWVSAHP